MTQQLKFSILTAPLAAIDRRSLSQAWYSALHLGRERSIATAGPASMQADARAGAALTHERNSATTARSLAASGVTRTLRALPAPLPDANSDRRTMRSRLSLKIEEALVNPRTRTRRSSFTIDGTAARVQVSLNTSERGVSLIAVCSPSARRAVAKALNEVRYALALRGVCVNIETRESV